MKFINPQAKKVMIGCIFYTIFFPNFYYIFLKVRKNMLAYGLKKSWLVKFFNTFFSLLWSRMILFVEMKQKKREEGKKLEGNWWTIREDKP
jgi:hypothetical protein